MCVILELKPNTDFPFEDLKTACQINKDGWGLLVHDRGKLELSNGFDPKGNNAEDIARILEDTKSQHRMLHLRFSTAGAKNIENCHPFQVLNKTDHGLDLYFMHNGTLYDFTKSMEGFSDSYAFNEKILKPLVSSARYCFGPEYLAQTYLKYSLREMKGNGVFAFFDSEGNTLKIENSECWSNKENTVWASNSYSFARSHARYNQKDTSVTPFNPPKVTSQNQTGTSLGKTPTLTTNAGGKNSSEGGSPPQYTKMGSLTAIAPNPVVNPSLKLEGDHLKEILSQALANKEGTTSGVSFVGFRKPSFLELTGLDNWEQLKYLDTETIAEMVELLPDLTTTLISDLIHLLISRKTTNTTIVKDGTND